MQLLTGTIVTRTIVKNRRVTRILVGTIRPKGKHWVIYLLRKMLKILSNANANAKKKLKF